MVLPVQGCGKYDWGVKFFYEQKCKGSEAGCHVDAHCTGCGDFSYSAHRRHVPDGASHQYYLCGVAGTLVCTSMCDAYRYHSYGTHGNTTAGPYGCSFRCSAVRSLVSCFERPADFCCTRRDCRNRYHWCHCIVSCHDSFLREDGAYLDVLCTAFSQRHASRREHCLYISYSAFA